MMMKGCLVGFVLQPHLFSSHRSFPGEGTPLLMESYVTMYALLLGRKEDGRERYLHPVLSLSCLQLQIISLPIVLEWYILLHFKREKLLDWPQLF